MTKTSYKVWKIEKKKSEYTDLKKYLEDQMDPYFIKEITESQATILRLKGHRVEKAHIGSNKQN
jgi:hypothetical protein